MKLRPRLAAARALLRSAPLCLSIPATLPLPPPHHSILLSLHPALPTYLLLRRPPRVGRAIFSSYLLPSCSTSPFLLHKITEAEERGGCHVAEHPLTDPASRPSCSVRAPSSPHPCPSPNQVPRLFSGSNGILSAAGGTIGKQRPEKNYPVPSPSLTNK